jgi:hypothetical protein
MAVGPKPAGELPTSATAAPARSPLGPFEVALALIIIALAIAAAQRSRAGARAAGPSATAGPDIGTERFFPIVC